jgi:hypothetical protein
MGRLSLEARIDEGTLGRLQEAWHRSAEADEAALQEGVTAVLQTLVTAKMLGRLTEDVVAGMWTAAASYVMAAEMADKVLRMDLNAPPREPQGATASGLDELLDEEVDDA